MTFKTANIISLVFVVIAFGLALILYPQLPDPMPSHWNAAGEVDGYMGKFWGVFLMPLVMVGMYLLFVAIPRIDPMKANIAKFESSYCWMMIGFTGYFLYIDILILLAGLGMQFNMTNMLMPAVGLLFIGIGFMIGNAKQNYMVGIRTPWTLANSEVWDKTHKLGKWCFIAAGIVVFLSSFLNESAMMFVMMTAIMLAAFVPIIYSYILWRNIEQGKS